MKIRYFMLPSIIISLMLLVLDNEKTLENKTIFNENKEISYPFFGIEEVDNYIIKYLNDYIIKDNKVLVDYDYINKDNIYYLTFYKYILSVNKIKSNTDSFIINTKDNTVSKTNLLLYNYDIIQNKVIDNESKVIALTFDDGPNYNTNKVLEVLEKYDVSATFFVLGSKIRENEYILERMVSGGMEIGNLISSDLHLNKEDKIEEEMNNTNNLIYEVTGRYPKLLRISYSSVNNKMKKVSKYPIITWNIDTLDWKYHNSKKIANRVINKVSDGDIVLMHDVYSATANALNIIIPELQKSGYIFVTVSELFYYKGITLKNDKVYESAR